MFRGIRTKFLFTFLIGMIATLVVVFYVSYSSIDLVYMRINERTINAELNQISNGVDTLLSETETMLLAQIIGHDASIQLSRQSKLSIFDLTYAIQDLSAEVVEMTGRFDYIDSVYVYVNEQWFLGMSDRNTRQYRDETVEWPSERVLKLLEAGDVMTEVAGNIKEEDFPLERDDIAYLMMYRKSRGSVFCVNIKESALFEMYSGFMEDGVRSIRILDSEGVIVSAGDKSEIGTGFTILEGENLASRGTVNADGVVTNYMPIERGLVVASSVPTSVYISELTELRNRLIFVFVFGMAITAVFFYYWIDQKLQPIKEIRLGMYRAGMGDYSGRLQVTGNDELSDLTVNYNTMLTNLQNLTERRKQVESELRERELAVLRNEINPHFLYNTLNTIKCMADLDGNQDVGRCIAALGGIIAPLYKENRPIWSLGEELTLVARYLEIMNIRYGNQIQYVEHISEELLERGIMRFILQPIIENSITHGFACRGYAGRIILKVEEVGRDLLITVEDDGAGMTDSELQKYNEYLKQGIETGGVGMMNVYRRIALRYGDGYGIVLTHSEYGGLCTKIRLP